MDFQSTLFAPTAPTRPLDFAGLERTELTRGAWVDVRALAAGRRRFERRPRCRGGPSARCTTVVDVPRLVHTS